MNSSKTKTEIFFQLILSVSEYEGKEFASSYAPQNFKSEEEAKEYWRVNYKERKQNDQYDQYWNNLPLRIQKVITTTEQIW